MDAAPLRAVLDADLAQLAARWAELPRPARPAARSLLWRGYRAIADARVARSSLCDVAAAVAGLLRSLPAPALLPAYRMRPRPPWPQILRPTLVGDRAAAWQTRLDRRWRVPVALSPERLAWFDQRVAARAPTQVATVRQPTEAGSRDALELVHKRGRSRFS